MNEYIVVKKGKTSKIHRVFVQDARASDGSGLTGLTSGSAGLTCYRARDDDGNTGAVQLPLVAGTRGTWSSGGFVEKDATNMPGVYELGLDNAGLAAGADSVVYLLKGAANMVPVLLRVQLLDYDPQDATRLGLSALPNAAAAASGGLPTVDANNAVKLQSGTGANQISLASGAVTVGTNNDKSGYSLTQSFPSNFAALAITAGGSVTVGTNNDKSGYSLTQSFPANFSSLAITPAGAVAMDVTAVLSTSPVSGSVGEALLVMDIMAGRHNTAQTGTSTTITLDSGASADTGAYIGDMIKIVSGTGSGQHRTITAYNPSTKLATVHRTWDVIPDNTSVFQTLLTPKADVYDWQSSVTGALPANFSTLAISGAGAVTVGTNNDKSGYSLSTTPPTAAQIATAIWQDLTAGSDFSVAGSIGASLAADITISLLSIYNLIGAPSGASIAADIAAVKTDTGSMQTTVQSALSAQGYTSGRAPNLDRLDAAVTSRSAPATPQTIDQTTALPSSPASGTVGEALKLADKLQYDSNGFVKTTPQTDPWTTQLPGSYAPGTAGYVLSHIAGNISIVALPQPTIALAVSQQTIQVLAPGAGNFLIIE